MEHNGKKSRCIVCVKNFDGKRGAQSHSSKIHHMTLDGRLLDHEKKKKSELEINQNLNPKEISPIKNTPNEDQMHNKTMNDADKMIMLNLKITQLEKIGLMQLAYNLREKYNIFKTKTDEKPETSIDNEFKNILLVMWNNENDPIRQNIIYNIILMVTMGMSDDMIMMGLMQLMNTPITKTPEKSEIEKQLELLAMKKALDNLNRDPSDDLIRYNRATRKNSNVVDGFVKCIKKLHSSNMESKNISPKPPIRMILPTIRISHIKNISSGKCITPLQISKFSKNTHDGYFEFDESANNTDSNLGNSTIPLRYADMNIPHNFDN